MKTKSVSIEQILASLFFGSVEGAMAFSYTRKYLERFQGYGTYWDYCNVTFYSDKFDELEYLAPLSVELLFMPILLALTTIFIASYKYFAEKKEYYGFVAVRCRSRSQFNKRLKGNSYLVICICVLSYLLTFHFLLLYQGIECNGIWKKIFVNFLGLWLEKTLLFVAICNVVYYFWDKCRESALFLGIFMVIVIYCVDFMFHLHIIYFHSMDYLYKWAVGLAFLNGVIQCICNRRHLEI